MAANQKVWLITGSSTGLGRALAEALIDQNERVVATARKPEQLDDLVAKAPDRVRAARLDVTRPKEIQAAVELALTSFGRIDVLVNNAGYGLLGAVEEVSESEVRNQFETNLFGALWMMQAALPVMREQKSGHILNISSVGGFCGFPGFGLYNSTKFALEGISEALAIETEPFGIHITIVEPGAFRTDWAGRSMTRSAQVMPEYADSSGQTRSWMDEETGNQVGDPVRAAEAMIKAVNAANPPQRLVLGADALERIREKITQTSAELDTWEHVTVDTAFPKSVAG